MLESLTPKTEVGEVVVWWLVQGPRGVLLQDPVVQWFKWNQEALDRATILCTDPVHRAEAARCTIHNSSSKQEDVGCLLEQVLYLPAESFPCPLSDSIRSQPCQKRFLKSVANLLAHLKISLSRLPCF